MTINHGLYTDTVWAVPVTFRDTSGDPIDLSGYDYVAELVANAGVVFRFKSAGAAAGEGTLGLANAATGVIAFNASIAQHASVTSGLYRVHLKRDLADDVWAAEGSMLVGAPGAKETYILFDDPGAEAAGAMTYAQQAAASAATAVSAAAAAGNDADEAAANEAAALSSKNAAAASAAAAASSQSGAAGSATAAAGSATAAATSAAAAAASEAAADVSEANAASSATAAAGSATASQTSRLASEAARDASITAKTASEAARDAAVVAKTAAETAEMNAEAAETNAEAAQHAAESARDAASGSATAAAGSATAASGSASAAATSASNAAGSATAASNSASNAASSASAASGSASAASTSATNAATSATAAQTARTGAETAQTGAQTARTGAEAAQSAASGSQAVATAAAQTATAQASLAQGYAASASSVVQQDLSGITAQALHRSPNAVAAMAIYDTSKDSDGGAWTEKCQHTSWYNEPLAGKWLGPQPSEANARYAGATVGSELHSNPDFANNIDGWFGSGAYPGSSTTWEAGAMKISVGSGVSYSDAILATPITVSVGKLYRITVNVRSVTNSWIMYAGNPSSAIAYVNTGAVIYPGTFEYYVRPTETQLTLMLLSYPVNAVSYIDGVSVREVTAINTNSGDYFQLTTDGKFYRLWKNRLFGVTVNPTTTSGLTLFGDAAATLTVVDDSAALAAAGLTGIASNGKVFRLNNTAGTANAFVRFNNATDMGSNTWSLSAYVRGSGTSVIDVNAGSWSGAGNVSLTSSYQRQVSTGVTSASPNQWRIRVGAGADVYFIMMQAEVSASATPYESNTSTGPTSEIFRGNKADFPRLSAIVSEAQNVTIYDLTEPGRPMWMRFASGGAGGGDAFLAGTASYTKRSLAAANGELAIGQIASGGFGLVRVNFSQDTAYAYSNAAAYGGNFNGNISLRNATRGYPWPGAAFAAVVASSTVNAVAMTVLPDAPIDPATGLRVPTIAVATGNGISVIRHDGTVLNGAQTGYGATGLVIDKSYRMHSFNVGGSGFYWYYSNPLPKLAASFSMALVRSDQAAGLNSSPPSGLANAVVATGAFQSAISWGTAGVQHYKSPAFGQRSRTTMARMTSGFNTGWMAGDIRRCFLSDTRVETISGAELIVNGSFDVNSDGWTSGVANLSVSSGKLTVQNSSAAAGFAYQVIPTVVGKAYRISGDVTGNDVENYPRIAAGTGPNSGNLLSLQLSVPMSTRNLAGVFVAISTATYINLLTNSGVVNVAPSFDNVTVKEADADRSWKVGSAFTSGTLTKAQLAAGTSLVGYSGFSASNYLREAYSAGLDFGTGEWTASAWVNVPVTLPVANFPGIGSELFPGGTPTVAPSGTGDNPSWVSGQMINSGVGTLTNYPVYSWNIPSLVIGRYYRVTITVTGGTRLVGASLGVFGIQVYAVGGTTIDAVIPAVAGGTSLWVLTDGRATFTMTPTISVKEASPAIIFDRAFSSGPRIRLGVNGGGYLTAESFDGTTTRTVTTGAAYNVAQWLKARVNYTTDGSLAILINGREVAVTRGTPLLTLNNSSAVLTIGNSYALDAPFPGSIALLKLGATVPTPEQSLFMYEQEKQLFRAGAQSVLPDSGSIVDMAYDDATDRWVAISATNESYWTGLVRNNVTPVPAGSYTKIAAASGVELAARSTTNPGVDVTIPAYGLREELVKRAEAAARLSKELSTFDYVGGFTANTTNGSTAITSASTITYPASYIGARISGTGIPANTTIIAVSGTTLYLSAAATATATGVSISFLDFALPAGMEARMVFNAGVQQREGSTAAFTRLYDGFVETIRFAVAPGATALVSIQA